MLFVIKTIAGILGFISGFIQGLLIRYYKPKPPPTIHFAGMEFEEVEVKSYRNSGNFEVTDYCEGCFFKTRRFGCAVGEYPSDTDLPPCFPGNNRPSLIFRRVK